MSNGRCILLAEDDPVLGPLTRDALMSVAHSAVLATTGTRAYVRLSQHHEFHVVILDLELHGERSEPIIERLRGNGCAVPPIVVLSAQPQEELKKACYRVWGCGVLQKPVTRHEIVTAVGLDAAECANCG